MKTQHTVLAALAALLILVSASCGNGPQAEGELKGSISVSGAFALYPMAQKWAEEFQKLHPGVTINISAGGAGKGMADVLAGMVDLAMFSREVKPEETSKGAWTLAVTRDAVFPTLSVNNPMYEEIQQKGLTKKQFTELYLKGTLVSWNQLYGHGPATKINVFNRSDACGAAEMWAKYLGGAQEDLTGVGVFGDPGIASAVKNDPLSVGFNNLNYVYDVNTGTRYPGLGVIPIDQNENGTIDSTEQIYTSLHQLTHAIREGAYPSPPARDLYFISRGKPENPIVLAFLHWILSDGQKYVDEAGYVSLKDEQIRQELSKLQ